jgi:hypothetical protein
MDLGSRPVMLTAGSQIYVEPQAVAATANRFLVAGTPTYLWTKGDSAFTLTHDSVIAIIADTSGASRAIRGPLGPGRTHDVRAAGLKDGRWVVAFAEGPPVTMPDEPDVSSLWIGILDTTGTWRSLEKLPPVSGRLISGLASLTALSADDVALAVPVERDDSVRVAVFVRTKTGWHQSQVMTGRVNYTTLILDDRGLLNLGVVHLDPSGAPDHNSFWLYRTSDAGRSWSPVVRLVRGKGQPVHHPEFSLARGRLTAVWMTRRQNTWEARFSSFTGVDSGNVVAFGEGAVQVFSENRVGGASIWTTYHQQSQVELFAQLRLWVSADNRFPGRIAAVSLPYDGVIGVTASDGLILAAGPVRAASPSDPPLSLALHRVAVRCD